MSGESGQTAASPVETGKGQGHAHVCGTERRWIPTDIRSRTTSKRRTVRCLRVRLGIKRTLRCLPKQVLLFVWQNPAYNTNTRARTHARTRARTHIHTHIRTYAHTHTHINTHTYTHTHTHTHTHTRARAYAHARTRTLIHLSLIHI